VCVWRSKVDPTFIERYSALTNMVALVGRIRVVPKLVARTRIDGPDIIRNREVQNSIHQDRRRLDRRCAPCLVCPGQRQAIHILRRDLRQSAVASARIVTVIAGPAISRRFKEHRRIHILRRKQARKNIPGQGTHHHDNHQLQSLHIDSQPFKRNRHRRTSRSVFFTACSNNACHLVREDNRRTVGAAPLCVQRNHDKRPGCLLAGA
jgi:hypothetical protein